MTLRVADADPTQGRTAQLRLAACETPPHRAADLTQGPSLHVHCAMAVNLRLWLHRPHNDP